MLSMRSTSVEGKINGMELRLYLIPSLCSSTFLSWATFLGIPAIVMIASLAIHMNQQITIIRSEAVQASASSQVMLLFV